MSRHPVTWKALVLTMPLSAVSRGMPWFLLRILARFASRMRLASLIRLGAAAWLRECYEKVGRFTFMISGPPKLSSQARGSEGWLSEFARR